MRHEVLVEPYEQPYGMTNRERRRFIRIYYLLLRFWLCYEESSWAEHLKSIPLNRLTQLYELSMLNQLLPHEMEDSRYREFKPEKFQGHRIKLWMGGYKRSDFRMLVREELYSKYKQLWKRDLLHLWAGQCEAIGAIWHFICVWDHFQPDLHDMCCTGSGEGETLYPNGDLAETWEDSEEEDGPLLQKWISCNRKIPKSRFQRAHPELFSEDGKYLGKEKGEGSRG